MDLTSYFFYIVIKRIILAVILAADGSHLINETINSTSLKRKQKQTQTCTRKHTLTCLVVRHLPIVQPLHMQCGQSQGK